MLIQCTVHGMSGYCIFSPSLLERQADGTVPEIVTVEVKDTAEEEAFFRFNITLAEAAALPIVDGRIPFDFESFEIMDRLSHGCGSCFQERRRQLKGV